MDRIAQALFCVHEKRFAQQRFPAVPARHVEVTCWNGQCRFLKSRLIEGPPFLEPPHREVDKR